MNPLTVIGLEVGLFGLVVLAVVAIGRTMETGFIVRRRLRGEAKAVATLSPDSLVRKQDPRNPILAWVQNSSLKDPGERQTIRHDLARAGFESQAAPAIYVIIRFLLAVSLPTAFILYQTVAPKPVTGPMFFLIPVLLAALGLMLPRMFIDNRAKARARDLEDEFPDALDLMVVCVEAGLALEASFIRVGNETAKSHPRISEQFQIVSQELRAGRTRADALRNLGDRAKVPMITSFVGLLIQTDSLGGSIAQTLRIYSQEMRAHRILRAEEKAMRIPVLLTIPLVGCILPVIFTAVMLPAVISYMRVIAPAMGGK